MQFVKDGGRIGEWRSGRYVRTAKQWSSADVVLIEVDRMTCCGGGGGLGWLGTVEVLEGDLRFEETSHQLAAAWRHTGLTIGRWAEIRVQLMSCF